MIRRKPVLRRVRFSIRTRLAVTLVLAVGVPLLATSVLSVRFFRAYLRSQEFAAIVASAEQLDEIIDMEKSDLLGVARTIAEDSRLRGVFHNGSTSRLREMARLYLAVTRAGMIAVLNAEGNLLFMREKGRHASAARLIRFDEDLSPVEGVDVFPVHRAIVIRAWEPVFEGKRILGHVLAAERLDATFAQRWKRTLGLEVAIAAEDSVVYSTFEFPIRLPPALYRELRSAKQQVYRHLRFNGQRYMTAAFPLLDRRGRYLGAVAIFAPEERALQAVATTERWMWITGAAALLVALVLAFVLGDSIRRAVQELTSKMREVMDGNYNVRAEVATRDELGQLADGFNEMLARIREHRRLLAEQKAVLEEQLRMAGHVQRLLVPKETDTDCLKVRVKYLPALEVSGDYAYYGSPREGVLYAIIGDVSGHGAAAALVMSRVSTFVEEMVEEDVGPAATVRRLNGFLQQNFSAANVFATLFCARIDLRSGQLVYSSAGHPAQFLVNGDGELQSLEATCPPVGLLPDGVFADDNERELALDSQVRLLLFTDGAYELDWLDGEMLGLERFREYLELGLSEGAFAFSAFLRDLEKLGTSQLSDDILLVDFWALCPGETGKVT